MDLLTFPHKRTPSVINELLQFFWRLLSLVPFGNYLFSLVGKEVENNTLHACWRIKTFSGKSCVNYLLQYRKLVKTSEELSWTRLTGPFTSLLDTVSPRLWIFWGVQINQNNRLENAARMFANPSERCCFLQPHRLISDCTNIYINERCDEFPSNCQDHPAVAEACITNGTASGFVLITLSLSSRHYIPMRFCGRSVALWILRLSTTNRQHKRCFIFWWKSDSNENNIHWIIYDVCVYTRLKLTQRGWHRNRRRKFQIVGCAVSAESLCVLGNLSAHWRVLQVGTQSTKVQPLLLSVSSPSAEIQELHLFPGFPFLNQWLQFYSLSVTCSFFKHRVWYTCEGFLLGPWITCKLGVPWLG